MNTVITSRLQCRHNMCDRNCTMYLHRQYGGSGQLLVLCGRRAGCTCRSWSFRPRRQLAVECPVSNTQLQQGTHCWRIQNCRSWCHYMQPDKAVSRQSNGKDVKEWSHCSSPVAEHDLHWFSSWSIYQFCLSYCCDANVDLLSCYFGRRWTKLFHFVQSLCCSRATTMSPITFTNMSCWHKLWLLNRDCQSRKQSNTHDTLSL